VLADKIHVEGSQAWGPAAANRLGLKWDEDRRVARHARAHQAGKSLGFVRDAVIDEHDGSLNGLGLTSGIAADMAVGTIDHACSAGQGLERLRQSLLKKRRRGSSRNGGAAAVCRTVRPAVVQDRAGKAGAAAVQGAKTPRRIRKSAVKVAARSDTAKKVGGFLKSMRDQIVDAAGVPDDDQKEVASAYLFGHGYTGRRTF